MVKSYCTQNNGDCLTCSLVNYNRDCFNKTLVSQAASALGKLGGSAKSEAKSTSSRENGKLGGRPRKAKEE